MNWLIYWWIDLFIDGLTYWLIDMVSYVLIIVWLYHIPTNEFHTQIIITTSWPPCKTLSATHPPPAKNFSNTSKLSRSKTPRPVTSAAPSVNPTPRSWKTFSGKASKRKSPSVHSSATTPHEATTATWITAGHLPPHQARNSLIFKCPHSNKLSSNRSKPPAPSTIKSASKLTTSKQARNKTSRTTLWPFHNFTTTRTKCDPPGKMSWWKLRKLGLSFRLCFTWLKSWSVMEFSLAFCTW